MTLIIGIKCSDGIVMGADGAATLGGGALGHFTVRQPVKKLAAIENSIIAGVSGPVGLAQRINGVMRQLWNSGQLASKQSFEAMTIIRNAIGEYLLVEIHYANKVAELLGTTKVGHSALTHTVIAAPIDQQLRLYQFDCGGAPEEATDDLPFIAIGSGQQLADPFLAFLRHVFWKDSLPNVAKGIFATLWSLEHAIRTNPGGVAEPMQLMILSKDEQDRCSVTEFAEEELEEHREAVREAESYLARFGREQGDAPPEPPPA